MEDDARNAGLRPAEADGDANGDAGAAGFDAIGELLAGFAPEQVPPLVAARDLELAYPLLHALTRGSLRDFLVRVAALEALVADGRSPLGPWDVIEALYWLREPAREQVLRTLRATGWLTYDTAAGYRITDGGRFVATVLSFLRARVREGSLLPTVEGIDYMLRLGVDPVRQLLLLRAQLEDLRNEMDAARRSHSEVILKAAAARLADSLAFSGRIRAVLARVPLDLADARRVAQDVHDLLSRLHGVGSDLHAAITEVGRQYLHLVAGLTTTDIVATLMQLDVSELADAGRNVLRPVVPPPPLVVPELLAATAEAHLARVREAAPRVEWVDPPAAKEAGGEVTLPAEVAALLDDLDRLAARGGAEPLSAVVPRGSVAESFLRASLLPLLGAPVGGEGVAGRLGALPLEVTVDGDGLPEPAPPPLAALTPGVVSRRREGVDG